ncbi:hypothetical protein DSO57_1008232 [Entomophthora muscae]|uniref:Uncharacterized protein n=1 Tax=Entomophthora muscae TaxID=34485 RepID=A0ACC2SW27_9FUNG|nr:hypothetical protein DSO57_1008232 [Entomophthora muscae]
MTKTNPTKKAKFGLDSKPLADECVAEVSTENTEESVKKDVNASGKRVRVSKDASAEAASQAALPVRATNITMPTDYSHLETPEAVKEYSGPESVVKLCTYNVASVKSASKKGLLEYIKAEEPTLVCLQETKLQVAPNEEYFTREQYPHQFWWCSTAKKGYSGTAVLSKLEPVSHFYGFKKQPQLDNEGRVITVEFADFFLVTAYVPNAGEKLVRLSYRLEWDVAMTDHLNSLEETGKPVIYTGDLNVAHHPIDLSRPKDNLKSAGFTIEERNSFTQQLAGGPNSRFPRVDVDRHFHPDEACRYTYHSYRSGARSKNIGWRLDYFVASRSFMPSILGTAIRFTCYGASDHLPSILWFKSKSPLATTTSKAATPKRGQSSITSFFKSQN